MNLAPNEAGESQPFLPGSLLEVDIIEATPHSLIGVPRAATTGAAPESPGFSGSRVKPTRGSADELGRAAFASDSKASALRIVR